MKLIEAIDDSKLIDRALELKGINWAADKLIGECAELTVSLCHHGEGKSTAQDIAGELADVLIGVAFLKRFVSEQSLNSSLRAKMYKLHELVTNIEAATAIDNERMQ